MFPRKNRIISVRVSAQEYDALQQQTEASGSPSVSEYMRSRIFESPLPDPRSENPIGRLASAVEELKTRFEHLSAFVGLKEDG